MEREELEYQLGRNRASIQEIKSERDRGKIADYDYKLLLEVALSEERFLSAVKARLDLVDRVAQLKKELSSTDIDSAPPVTVFEEETSSYKVLSPRQYKELELRSAMFYMPGLDAEIPRHGHEYVRLYKLALRVLPGFKPDEIQKKLAAESVQMGNHVSTSAASPAQSAANKAATEPELAVEAPQESIAPAAQRATESEAAEQPAAAHNLATERAANVAEQPAAEPAVEQIMSGEVVPPPAATPSVAQEPSPTSEESSDTPDELSYDENTQLLKFRETSFTGVNKFQYAAIKYLYDLDASSAGASEKELVKAAGLNPDKNRLQNLFQRAVVGRDTATITYS